MTELTNPSGRCPMNLSERNDAMSTREIPRRKTGKGWFRRDWRLYAMLLLPIAFYLIFCYKPMLGLVIAFFLVMYVPMFIPGLIVG